VHPGLSDGLREDEPAPEGVAKAVPSGFQSERSQKGGKRRMAYQGKCVWNGCKKEVADFVVLQPKAEVGDYMFHADIGGSIKIRPGSKLAQSLIEKGLISTAGWVCPDHGPAARRELEV